VNYFNMIFEPTKYPISRKSTELEHSSGFSGNHVKSTLSDGLGLKFEYKK